MHNFTELQKYAQTLTVLYVEDNDDLRKSTAMLFERLFKKVDLAINGLDGLEKYNQGHYDVVITDINMPKMNGLEMIEKIKEINFEQKVMTITAHNESEILIDIIKKGVNGFILKPIGNTELMTMLSSVVRDAYAQNMNLELLQKLTEEKEKLEQQNRELRAQSHTIDTKHQQLEKLLQEKKPKIPVMEQYFAKDDDEGKKNVLLISDDCDELLEIFNEIPELISHYSMKRNRDDLVHITDGLSKVASIMLHYAPYLNTLSDAINELSAVIGENMDAFASLLEQNVDGVLMLFDAVCSDMERYVERFSVESMAMHNIHHIHEPTALSIQQIIGMIVPENVDYGDLEFF